MSDNYGWANKITNGMFRSRSQKRANLNLGIIQIPLITDQGRFRDPQLELLDAYYENRQYEKLPPFDNQEDANGKFIPVRQRQPRFSFAFGRTLSARVAAKLVGPSVWPSFRCPDSPDDQDFFEAIIESSKLKSFIMEPIRRELNTGAVFVRFYLVAGTLKLLWYPAKFCYPTFQENGELETVRYRYVFQDMQDLDTNGSPKNKWYQADFGMMSEILYDNPLYEPGKEPTFEEVSRVDHNFGFVQGEWFSTTGEGDGYGLIEDIMPFIDEVNYSLSQSSNAIAYNQDPQLTLKNMTEDEMTELIRSSTKAWNLGRQGEAHFLESNLAGVKTAIELRDKVNHNISDITRIVLLDPEKIVGSAQSAKAMEVLHGPLKDLVDELRFPIGASLNHLVIKMGIAVLISNDRGIPVPLNIPPGFTLNQLPQLKWPAIFQQTMEDLQKKVQVAAAASNANLISRKTALRFIAEDFGVTDIDQEQADIAAQPVFNPFGGF